MHAGRSVSSDGCATSGEGMSRRLFLGGMSAMMASAALVMGASSTALGDEAADAADAEGEDEEAAVGTTTSALTGWTGTPEDVLALGVSTMPLADLNEYRRQYVEAQTEYTCADGTVVPRVYMQMRALVHSYGQGCGNTPVDTSCLAIMQTFTEDQVQGYLEMPWGVEFTAYEFAAESGRDVEEAEELCELFASEGYLCAFNNNRGRGYHQVPYFQGVIEYQLDKVVESDYTDLSAYTMAGSDTQYDMIYGGTPVFYYVPIDKSVVSGGEMLPFDDLKEKIKSRNYVAICPCACRITALAAAVGHDNIPSLEDFATGEYEDYFSELCDQRVETCIMTGDEAEYWVERGFGRRITGEEGAAYIERSIEDGFMLESTFGKNTETICSCHIKSCNILNSWAALGDAETIASAQSFKQASHYTLEVDPDKCIACGLCVERCPMQIITINDEGWAEPAANCFRCGQCAYVCPQGARQLVQRDESELAPLPQGMVEDMNVKAAYRFEKGLIF